MVRILKLIQVLTPVGIWSQYLIKLGIRVRSVYMLSISIDVIGVGKKYYEINPCVF